MTDGCNKPPQFAKAKIMRFGKLFLAALIAGAALAAHADPALAPSWQEYRSDAGGYRIEMPGKPAESTTDLPSAPGKKMYAATLSYGKGGMLAIASDVGENAAANGDKILDSGRDTALKNMGATISNERKETVGGYPARRFDYSSPNGYRGTIRFVLTNQHLYQLNAIGPAGFSESAEAKHFLNSFALTGK
jgi:hypothetical protein